ncbi:tetratricopeptide repeat protein [Streptomyces sp. MAR4 CNY-716]
MGRESELAVCRAALGQGSTAKILNVSGLAGVGKSTLVEQFASMARTAGGRAAMVNARRLVDPRDNHVYPSVVESLLTISKALRLRKLAGRLRRYRMLHRRLTEMFEGSEEAAVATMLQVGVAAVRAGSTVLPVAKPLDAILTPQLVTKVSQAIGSYKRESDRELISNPVERLSELFVTELNALASGHGRVALIFDEYELSTPELDYWLRQVLDGIFGELDPRILLVVAGRQPLGQDWTARGQTGAPGELVHIVLERFNDEETAQYLMSAVPGIDRDHARQLADVLSGAYRLPLILRLLVSRSTFVADIETATGLPHLGVVQHELVGRLLNEEYISPARRTVVLYTSVARSFDARVVAVVDPAVTTRTESPHFEWLVSQHFVNPRAPLYTYYDILREIFVRYLRSVQPDKVTALHRELAEHYESREGGRPALEAAYHRLSASTGNVLAEALQLLFQLLQTTVQDYAEWSVMLAQVADERDESIADQAVLRRLSAVLAETARLSTPMELADSQLPAADPATNILFASSFDDSLPEVSDADAELWLTYFESRLKIAAGDASDVVVAQRELSTSWRAAEHIATTGAGENLLQFRIATDLADVHTRRGDLGRALEFSKTAVGIARRDGSPVRHAFALYQLSNTLKRQGKYHLALRNLGSAIALVRGRPAKASQYYLGRFMLDKAITLTYLNDTTAAEQAFEESRQCFAAISPLSYAELSHRLGWLKRIRGDLVASLRDHDAAVRAFRERELEILAPPGRLTGTSYLLAKALHSMGNVYAEMCRHDLALDCYTEAAELFRRQGGVRHEAILRKDMTWSTLMINGVDAAEEQLLRAVNDLGPGAYGDQRSSANSHTHLAEGWLNLSILRCCSGKLPEAAEAVSYGVRLLEGDRNNLPLLARLQVQESIVCALTGDTGRMAVLCEAARSYALSHVPPLRRITADVCLASAVAARTGSADASERWLDAARNEAAQWNEFAPLAMEEYWSRLVAGRNGEEMVVDNPPVTAVASIDEMVDVYDENGELRGQATSRLAHSAGLWHRSFHCWIVSPQPGGTGWSIVLQRRGEWSRSYANYLDISVAGHYRAGEGIEGGIRECQEELGINVHPDQLCLIARRTINERVDNGSLNREFQDIYLMRAEPGLESYRLGYPEVAAVYECDLAGLRDLVSGRAERVAAQGKRIAADGSTVEDVRHELGLNDLIGAAREYHKSVFAAITRILSGADTTSHRNSVVDLADGSRWEELV